MPTQTFDFFIDRKVSHWVREYHQIQSESLDDAKAEIFVKTKPLLCD